MQRGHDVPRVAWEEVGADGRRHHSPGLARERRVADGLGSRSGGGARTLSDARATDLGERSDLEGAHYDVVVPRGNQRSRHRSRGVVATDDKMRDVGAARRRYRKSERHMTAVIGGLNDRQVGDLRRRNGWHRQVDAKPRPSNGPAVRIERRHPDLCRCTVGCAEGKAGRHERGSAGYKLKRRDRHLRKGIGARA